MGLMIWDYRKFDRAALEKDFTFEEWLELSDEEKRYIYKFIWNPGRPEIGAATREDIISRFRESLNIPDEDICRLNYSYFGACVGAIHIVLTNPSHRVPSHFAWLPVNKGVFANDRIRWRWTQ